MKKTLKIPAGYMPAPDYARLHGLHPSVVYRAMHLSKLDYIKIGPYRYVHKDSVMREAK